MKKILLTGIIFISALSIAYCQCTKPAAVIITAGVTPSVCEGNMISFSGNVTVAAASQNGGFTYSWIKTVSTIIPPTKIDIDPDISAKVTDYTIGSAAISDAGTYVLRVEDGNAGNAACYTEASITLTVNPKPTITGTLYVCNGQTTQLTGSAISDATAPWSSATTSVATINSAGIVTGVADGTSNIFYKTSYGCVQSATVTVSQIPIITGTLTILCEGGTTQLKGSGIATASDAWNSSAPAIATVDNTGLVTAISNGTSIISYKNNSGCTKTATVTVGSGVPSVSVHVNTSTTICAGTSVTFTAIPTNGGTVPTYQWHFNGIAISGATNSTYTTTESQNGDSFSVQMISNLACTSIASATSNVIQMTVIPTLIPSVSITADLTAICKGNYVVFTAAPINGGTAPVYEWVVNAVSQGAPSSNNTFGTSTLRPNDGVSVRLTSNATCASSISVSSTALPIQVNVGISPGSIGSNQTICYGTTPAIITELTASDAASPLYYWESSADGIVWATVIAGASDSTLTFVEPLTADIFIRRVVASTVSPAPCNVAVSNVVHITVLPVLVAGTISNDETICEGIVPSIITATKTPQGGTGTYTYQWESSMQSGGPYTIITDETNSSYSPGTLQYTMYFKRLETSGLCGSVSSNEVAKTIASTTLSTIHIDDPGATCDGDIVLFKCKATNVGIAPVYNWYVNNNIVFSNSPAFTTSNLIASLKNGDEVWVELISNNACTDVSTIITSNKIIVNLIPCTVSNSIYTTTNIDILLQQYVSNSIPDAIDYTYFWSITTPVITGPNPISPGQQNTVYSVLNQQGYTYTWSVTGGTIVSGQNTNTITVDWNGGPPIAMARTTVPSYAISVTQTNQANESKTTSMEINTVTTAVALPIAQSGIQFYPNPATDAFNIVMPQSEILVNYAITDLAGTAVANGTFTSTGGEEKILTDFNAGLYQVVLKYNGNVTCLRLNKVQ